jgi:hypothetical protein
MYKELEALRLFYADILSLSKVFSTNISKKEECFWSFSYCTIRDMFALSEARILLWDFEMMSSNYYNCWVEIWLSSRSMGTLSSSFLSRTGLMILFSHLKAV